MKKYGLNGKGTALIIGSQIAGIVLSCVKGRSKKAKAAGILATLAGGEAVSYAITRHNVKKFDPNAKYSVADHYKSMFELGVELGKKDL